MANGKSDIQTAKEARLLYGTVPGSKREQEVRYAAYTITLLGNEASGAYHTLDAQMPSDNIRVVPELCRIRNVSGTYNVTTLLQKVDAAGNLTALSTTSAAYQGAAVLTLAPANANALPVIGKTDGLRLNFPTVTATNAGAQFEVEIAYREHH